MAAMVYTLSMTSDAATFTATIRGTRTVSHGKRCAACHCSEWRPPSRPSPRASREEMQLVEEIAAECKLLGAQLRRAIDAWLQPAIVAATGAGSTGAGSTGAGSTEPPAQTAAMIAAAPLAPTGRRGV